MRRAARPNICPDEEEGASAVPDREEGRFGVLRFTAGVLILALLGTGTVILAQAHQHKRQSVLDSAPALQAGRKEVAPAASVAAVGSSSPAARQQTLASSPEWCSTADDIKVCVRLPRASSSALSVLDLMSALFPFLVLKAGVCSPCNHTGAS